MEELGFVWLEAGGVYGHVHATLGCCIDNISYYEYMSYAPDTLRKQGERLEVGNGVEHGAFVRLRPGAAELAEGGADRGWLSDDAAQTGPLRIRYNAALFNDVSRRLATSRSRRSSSGPRLRTVNCFMVVSIPSSQMTRPPRLDAVRPGLSASGGVHRVRGGR